MAQHKAAGSVASRPGTNLSSTHQLYRCHGISPAPFPTIATLISSHLLFNNITYYCTIQSWDRHKSASRLTQGATPFLRVVKLTGFSTDRPPPAPLPRGRSARPSKHTLSIPSSIHREYTMLWDRGGSGLPPGKREGSWGGGERMEEKWLWLWCQRIGGRGLRVEVSKPTTG